MANKSVPEIVSFPELDGKKVLVFTSGGRNRRPRSYIPRYGRAATTGGAAAATSLRDPYGQDMKDRFEDTYRSDGNVKRAIDKKAEMLLGKHGKTVLDTTEEFNSYQEKRAALDSINSNQTYLDAKKDIDHLQSKKAIRFHDKLISATKQTFIYGRAAIEIVKDTDDWPIALHVLNSKRLGKVEVDPNTWAFEGVHYADLPTNDDLLKAEDLIYFTINDDHVTPRSIHYGLSILEPVIDASETKRIIKQEDLKEAAKTLYAGVALIRFMNESITAAEMQNFANQITPGGWTSHKYDIEVTLQKIADNLQQMVDICDFCNREELRDIGIPSFIGGYEQIANYANSQQVLLAYKEVEINTGRTWLKDIIQTQWLNPLFYNLTGIDDSEDALQYPEVKLNYEFEDITFETTLDKVNTVLPLFDHHLISGEKVLKYVDMEDVVEEFQSLKMEKDMNSERQFQLKLEALKARPSPGPGEEQGPPFPPSSPAAGGQPQPATTSVRQAKADLFLKLAKKIDDI
jgi:hypothetical protein